MNTKTCIFTRGYHHSSLVKILLFVFSRWNKIQSYTEKFKYPLCKFWVHIISNRQSCLQTKFEPPHDKINKNGMCTSEDSDQLGIRPVWSVFSLSAWRKLGPLATHWAHSEDSDQTGRTPRLIWVFAGRTVILLVFSRGGSFFRWWPPCQCSLSYWLLVFCFLTADGKVPLWSYVFQQIGLCKQCRARWDCSESVCHSVCIFRTHYSMAEPHCSNFRIIRAIFLVSEFLGILR